VVSSATAALAPEAPLVDLGEHRFKDLAEPEHVFQVGGDTFARLTSLGRTSLPAPATPLVGRVSELAEVSELAGREDIRVLTLTGPGGTGKTRLALHAAAEVSGDYPAGVFWVPLAAVRDPSVVPSILARELGSGASEDAIAGELAGRRVLLVLDNAEHLLPEVAGMIARLVSVEGPTVLVTSRERLRLRGEHTFAVPSLDRRDAEELFVARARQVDSAFVATPAVAELCRRLDDLPLAIELAAARTSMFTAEQLLERVCGRLDLLTGSRDADPRQQTLRATIEWSYDLLEPAEQRLFARLSVFVSGCSYEAAETVCGASVETLEGLLDKSFLRRRPGPPGTRYVMLETIREYGLERLAATGGEARLREWHADWVVSVVERVPVGSIGAEFDAARAAVTAERAEVFAALSWTREAGRAELALRIGAGIGSMWPSLFLEDAQRWLDYAVGVLDQVPPAVGARALRACGTIAFFVLADAPRAMALWEQALELATEAGDEQTASYVRYRLAMAAWEHGDPAGAAVEVERALGEARERGDRPLEIQALHHLGELERDLGNFDRAEQLMRESMALSRQAGDAQMADQTNHSLADLNLDRGTLDEAGALYAESLRLAVKRAESRAVVYCIAGIAAVLAGRGEEDEAALLWGAAERGEVRAGFRMLASERVRYSSRLDGLSGSPAWEAGRELDLDAAAERALGSLD
jgi:predicted ATPase